MSRDVVEVVDSDGVGGMSPEIRDREVNLSGLDREAQVVARYFTMPRRLEGLTTAALAWWEWDYDLHKVTTEGNEWGNSYSWFTSGIGQNWAKSMEHLTSDPDARLWRDSMGDVLEISGAQFVIQAGIYALQEKTGKKILNDEQVFWVSLLLPLVVKAGHSLGLFSIFGIHDRMGDPAVNMLIGQAAAAGALILAHYTGRRFEISKRLKSINASNEDANAKTRIDSAISQLALEDAYDN